MSIVKKIKEKPLPFLIGFLIFLVVFSLTMILTGNSENNRKKKEEFDIDNFSYKDLNSYGDSDYLFEDTSKPAVKNEKTLAQKYLDSVNAVNAKKNVYKEEQDSLVKAYQEHIKALEKQYAKPKKVVSNKITESKKVLEEIEAAKKKEEILDYYKKKRERYKTKKQSKSKEFRAAFFGNQRLLPGEDLKLFIVEDLHYKGMVFPKGTHLYAEVSILQNRVLLKIDNIAHVQLDLEVRALNDGRFGVPSDQVRKLWDMYKDDNIDNSTEEIADILRESTKSRFFDKTMSAISNFFERKRVREKDKLFFLNDHEVIITIKS